MSLLKHEQRHGTHQFPARLIRRHATSRADRCFLKGARKAQDPMKKLHLVPAAFVPLIWATLAALAQPATDDAGRPGMTANPGLNNQQSDPNNQPNAPSRPRNTGTMENGAASNGATRNGTPSSMPNDAASSSQSVSPGSAPQGSTPPQLAKPRPDDADNDTSTTASSAAPNDAATSAGTGQSVAPGSAPKGSTEPQMAKPDAREASKMDSDAPSSALPPPGSTEGADANKP
jgi:hypothetical protein